MSRRAGEGTHNYVIFDDQDVNIRAKYSLRPVEHTPEFRAFFGDWEIAASRPVRAASTFEEARAHAATFLNQPLVNRASGIVAQVSGGSLKKMLNAKAVAKSESPAAHALAVANLDDLFARAVLGWSKPDEHGDSNIRAIHRFFAPMMRGDRPMLAKLTVKETAQVNRANPLYTVEAVEFNEKSPAAQWVGEIADADGIDPRTTRSAGDIQTLARRVQDFQPDAVSKVVDADGRPLVVYHGTTKPPFTRFDPARSPAELHGAYFFTDDPDTADFHAQGRWRWAGQPQPMGGHVYPVYLNLRNPMRVDDQKIGEPELEAEMIDDAIRAGHDGIIATNEQTGERTFIVFDPRQIKSATGNRGTFDPKDPDLRYSLRPVEQVRSQSTDEKIVLTGEELGAGLNHEQLIDAADQVMRAIQHELRGKMVNRATGETIDLLRPGRKKILALAGMSDRLRIVPAIPMLIERGVPVGPWRPADKPSARYKDYRTFSVAVELAGKQEPVAFVVGRDPNGRSYYLHRIGQEETARAIAKAADSLQLPDPGDDSGGNSIIDAPSASDKENPPDLQFSRRPGEYYTPDESPRRGKRPTLKKLMTWAFSDKSDAGGVVCTDFADLAARRWGGEVFGWFTEDNPTATEGRDEGGHDIAVIGNRWIVDTWGYHVGNREPPIVMRVDDPAVEFNEKSPAAQWVDAAANADGVDPISTRSAGDIQTLARRVQDFQPDAVSKVVDADGRPLVVYHGTDSQIWAFNPVSRGNITPNNPESFKSFAFTDKPKVAEFYAVQAARIRFNRAQPYVHNKHYPNDPRAPREGYGGVNIMPVYLNVRNPLIVRMSKTLSVRDSLERAIAGGHDGLIVRRIGSKAHGLPFGDYYLVFSPTQIKSATGNRGTFDPKDPDLRYSLRPVDQQLANDARRQLRAIADGGAIDFTEVHLPSLQPHLSRALAAAGLAVPAHTPQVASVERVRHAIGHPARLTADELAAMPDVVSAPDWIGTTTTRGFKRVYFLKQNGGDKLYIAVYGRRRGRLGMVTFYTEAKNRILEDFKNKGVPLVTVANSAVRPDEGEPGRPTPGLFATEGTPETPIIDAPRPPGKENPPDLQFSRRPGEYYTPDESPRRGGRPTRSPEAPSPRPAGPAAPVGPRNPQPGDFAGTPAQTPTGRKLLARLAKDAAGRKVGPRAIVDWLHEQLGTFVVVGKTNTTRRHPAHYSTRWHYVRSRAGQWSLNVHEAGHARSAIRRMALTDQRPVGGMRSAGQSNGPELKRWMRK